ncbi:MAG: DUF86 domain-containing protein [Leptospiraceae bacterium]|nr:DUF86 domain-containing protein [Leptospiraceae bacterium]MCK6380838.1 DUF86 domain-containing protein [Leptospiraceae bacterium]NUM42920.1 DUF86 domain-containing protein [Leptospiraceae bacterium]
MKNRYFQSLYSIHSSLENIENYFGTDKNFEKYDSMLQHAVERNLEIIGEAIKRIFELDPNVPIASSRAIINTRNKIAHSYDEIENTQIWEILVNHLPILKKEVFKLLNEN